MSWDYAELSKLAKANGGPEKLVEILVDSGKSKMLPAVGVAALCGVGLTLATQKAIKFFTKRKKQKDELVEKAKEELIQGIKDYDTVQENADIALIDNDL